MATATDRKLLLAASEVTPFAKTGGLADVAGSLPRALSRRGWQCALVLPLYNSAASRIHLARTEHTFSVPIGKAPGVRDAVAGRLARLASIRLPDRTARVFRA